MICDCFAVVWNSNEEEGHEEVQLLEEALDVARRVLHAHPGVTVTIVDWEGGAGATSSPAAGDRPSIA
jgi:hypothetical protein